MRKGIKKETTPKIFTGPTEEDYKEMNKKLGLNNIKIDKQLTLRVSEKCHAHIRALHVKYAHKEWLAICKVEQVEPGIFEIVDMIHPEQTASSGSVTATDKGMDWSVDYLMEKGEDLSKWNLILHSHHSMGVFWSGTDDNARLGYNDGRFMCWAVVTAYKGEPSNGEISYKGCVNFYKPYNIEIDCVVEQPERDLYIEADEFVNQDKIYEENLKTKKREILEKLIEDSLPTINSLSDQVDYSRIINYLGIDITKELFENYGVVSTKIPNPQVQEFLIGLEKQAEEEAKAQTPQEEKEAPQEVLEWYEWHEGLETQIVKAFETGEKTKSWGDYGYYTSGKWKRDYVAPATAQQNRLIDEFEVPSSSAGPTVIEEDDYDDTTIYTTKWFPTRKELADELNLAPEDMVIVDTYGCRKIWSTVTHRFEYVEDWLDLFDYSGSFEPPLS